MPIHDWTRVDAGLFHAFHHSWITTLAQALNSGILPPDHFALPERAMQGPNPDEDAPPRSRLTPREEEQIYVRKADHIAVHHGYGNIVAVVEIVSPGNKASAPALRTYVENAARYFADGVHLLVIDLFPPSKRDPQGIHKAIWSQFMERDVELPAGKPLTVVSYEAQEPAAYIEPVAVGDVLPEMPIFLKSGYYVPTPLEATYQAAWSVFPAPLKRLLETPKSKGNGR